MFVVVDEAVQALRRVVATLEPERLSGDDAARLVSVFAEAERLGGAGKALAARRVAGSNRWRADGDKSAAHWLARSTGTSMGDAIGTLQTAERLADLPATDEAFRSGALSSGQAREISSAAAVAPQAEESLLRHAKVAGFSGLREQCRKVAAAGPDEVARHDAVHRSRHLRHWTEADGAFRLDVRTTAVDGAVILAGLQPHSERIFRAARDAGRKESTQAYAADALVAMARSSSNGDARSRPAAVHVVVDASALRRGHAEPGERCHIPGVGPVPVATARGLLGDAVVDVVITDGVDVANVTHLGRTVTAHQRNSLLIRDPECVVPGCHAKEHLEIDHVTGWALTKTTCLGDLARLCAWHHQQKTTGGYRLQGPPGAWQWLPPPADGQAEPVDQRGRPPPQLTLAP